MLLFPFLLAILMVSTLRYHGVKEIDPKRRKPFYLLVAIVAAFVLIFMYPEIVIFIFSIGYMLWGVFESIIIFNRKRRFRGIEQ